MDNGYMVHGSASDRIERLLDEATATIEPERPRSTVPRRPHLPRRPARSLVHADRESGK